MIHNIQNHFKIASDGSITIPGNLEVTGTITNNGGPVQSGGGGLWTADGSNTVLSDGNVGIGTTAPAGKLDVRKGSSVQYDGVNDFLKNLTGEHAIKLSTGGHRNATVINSQTGVTSPTLDSTGLYLNSSYGAHPFSSSSIHVNCSTGNGDISFLTGIGTTVSTTKVKIMNNGNVGIGTTSPSYPLDIIGTLRVSEDQTWLRSNSNTSATLYVNQEGTNASAVFLGGNVGIGTTSPSAKLDVDGSIKSAFLVVNDNNMISSTEDAERFFHILGSFISTISYNGTSIGLPSIVDHANSAAFIVGGFQKMLNKGWVGEVSLDAIANNLNFGTSVIIQTSDDGVTWSDQATATTNQRLVYSNSVPITKDNYLKVVLVSNSGTANASESQCRFSNLKITGIDSSLRDFYYNKNLIIDKNGNVGIGTIAPTSPLHIVSISDRILSLEQPTGTPWNIMDFRYNGITNGEIGNIGSEDANINGGLRMLATNGNNLYLGTAAGSGVNATNNFTILNGSGNVGIGTITPTSALHIDGPTDNSRTLYLTSKGGAGGSEHLGQYMMIEGTNDSSMNPIRLGHNLPAAGAGYIGNARPLVTKATHNASLDFERGGAVENFAIRAESGIEFATDGPNLRMSIDHVGDVGIKNKLLVGNDGGSNGTDNATMRTFGRLVVGAGSDETKSAITVMSSSGGTALLPKTIPLIEGVSTTGSGVAGIYTTNEYTNNSSCGLTFKTTDQNGATQNRMSFVGSSGDIKKIANKEYLTSNGLANGESVQSYVWGNDSVSQATVADSYGRSAGMGVYKNNALTYANGYFWAYDTASDLTNYLWVDAAGVWRTGKTGTNIGISTGGTALGSQTSDERLKNIDEEFNYGLSEVLRLNPISFSLKSDESNTKKLGFGAQSTQEIIPESVGDSGDCIDGYDIDEEDESKKTPKSEDTILNMEYVQLIPVLTKAIQELKTENDELKERLISIENWRENSL
jgi:hypothetical protein